MTFVPLVQEGIPQQKPPLPDAPILLSDDNIDECLTMRVTMDDPSNGCSLLYIGNCYTRYVLSLGQAKHYTF